MSTFKAVLLKGNIHLKDDGTSNIKIRVTHNRKADYISTDLFIIPTEFDENAGVAKLGRNRDYINYRITDKLKEFRQLDIKLGDRKEIMTVYNFRFKLYQNYKTDERIFGKRLQPSWLSLTKRLILILTFAYILPIQRVQLSKTTVIQFVKAIYYPRQNHQLLVK